MDVFFCIVQSQMFPFLLDVLQYIRMSLLFSNNVLCDVVLEVADEEIPVHKLVMASGSPYFMAMFNGKSNDI